MLALIAEQGLLFYDSRKARRDLCEVNLQDGGDGEVKVSPRDIVYTLSAEDAAAGKPAQVLATTDLRYP